MKKANCVLRFDGYEVISASLKKNDTFHVPENGEVSIEPELNRKITNNGNKMNVLLKCEIKNSSAPFMMFLELEGHFSFTGESDNSFKKALEANATAILYPYFRSTITMFTANMNYPALTLPTINIHDAFAKDEAHNK